MTFPDCLRELARLRPEKFWVTTHVRVASFRWSTPGGERYILLTDNWFTTQDVLDSLLAKLGREYQLFPRVKEGKATEWSFIVWENGKAPSPITDQWFANKSLAAQAALIAAVEEIKKGEKG